MLHIPTFVKSCLLAAALALTGTGLSAQEFKAGDLRITQPWTRATPTGAKTAAGYLKITNSGKEADTLVSASSDGAEVVEVHEMTMKDSVMTMRRLEKGVEIKPGQTVELKPGSFHLMMIGVKEPFEKGKVIKGTLTFAKAGTVAVEFKVEGPGGPAGKKPDHSGH
jgi:periplasmic copper chaperone A